MHAGRDDDDDRWSASAEDAWRLLVEPMDRDEAIIAAQAITRALPHVHAYPADPRTELVLAWDRWTVELMRDGLVALERTGRSVPRQIIDEFDHWLALAEPAEAAAVPMVEKILESSKSRHSFVPQQGADGRHVAAHALWICACVTEQEAPTWIIYDGPDGDGLGWCRIPDGLDVDDVVLAPLVAGGHTSPEEFLGWLRGDFDWSALDVDGDAAVMEALAGKIRE